MDNTEVFPAPAYFAIPHVGQLPPPPLPVSGGGMNRLHQIKTGNIFRRCSRFSFDLAGSIPRRGTCVPRRWRAASPRASQSKAW